MAEIFDLPKAEVVRQLKRSGLELHSLRLLGAGDFTRAWLANDQIVVRFARHAEAEAALRREAAVLPWLSQRLSFAIPQPELHEPQPPARFGYVTYPLVAGTPITRKRFLAMTPAERDRCGASVAQLLHELHAVPVEWPQTHGVPTSIVRQRYSVILLQAKRLLPDTTPVLAQFLERLARRYVAAAADGTSTNVLLHGDLGPPHILSAHERSPIATGVIDWGDMQIGPPAWDLVYLYEDLGPTFMQALLAHLHTQDKERLLQEMYLFYQLDLVASVVQELEVQDAARTKQALAQLERLRVRAEAEPWRKLL